MSIGTTTPMGSATQSLIRSDDAGLLGKDDFLKLFVAQLRNQDPMSPTEDKEFMAQMAQFSQLEQITNMAKALDRLSFSEQASQSVALIGRTVEWAGSDGVSLTGTVTRVTFEDGEISVHVGDTTIAPDEIRSVT